MEAASLNVSVSILNPNVFNFEDDNVSSLFLVDVGSLMN